MAEHPPNGRQPSELLWCVVFCTPSHRGFQVPRLTRSRPPSAATADHELLVTEEYGRILEVRDFILEQPEVSKFRWKDTDFTKESVAAASGGSPPAASDASAPAAAKPKPNKSSKKKGKSASATPAAASKGDEL